MNTSDSLFYHSSFRFFWESQCSAQPNQPIKLSNDNIQFVSVAKLTKKQDAKKLQIKINKKTCTPSILWVLIFIAMLPSVQSQCCAQISNGKCIRCPQNMHLYRTNCFFNIPKCTEYYSGFQCTTCQNGYELTESRMGCRLINQKYYRIVFSELPDPKFDLFQKIRSSLQSLKIMPTIQEIEKDEDKYTEFDQVSKINYNQYYTQEFFTYIQNFIKDRVIVEKIQKIWLQNKLRTWRRKNPDAYLQSSIIKTLYTDNRPSLKAILKTDKGYTQIKYKINVNYNQYQKMSKSERQSAGFIQSNYNSNRLYIDFIVTQMKFFSLGQLPYKKAMNQSQIWQIKRYLGWRENVLREAQIFDAYKVQQNKSVNYKLYLLHSSTGMVDVTIVLDQSAVTPTKTFVQLSKNLQLNNFAKQIWQANTIAPYLRDSEIASILSINYDGYVIYNITIRHPKIQRQLIFLNPIQKHLSYILFNYNANYSTIYIRKMFLYLLQLQRERLKGLQTLQNLKKTKILDMFSYQLSSDFKRPTKILGKQKQLSLQQNLPFIQIIDLQAFTRTKLFLVIQQFINGSIASTPNQNRQLKKALKLENISLIIYQLHFSFKSDQDQRQQHFRFSLQKQINQIEFNDYYIYRTPQRIFTRITNKNRQEVVKSFVKAQASLLSFVYLDSLYHPDSFLVEATITNISKSFLSGAVTTVKAELIDISIYAFKFYYPEDLHEPYQFIEYRYAIPSTSIPSTLSKRKQGHVIIPKQKFIPVSLQERAYIKNALDYYIVQNNDINQRVDDYHLIYTNVSQVNKNLYQVSVLINKQSYFVCRIQQKNIPQYLILSIQKATDPNIYRRYINWNIAVIPKYMSNFPEIKSKQISIPVQNYENSNLITTDSIIALSIEQIRRVILQLLNNNNIVDVYNVQVLGRKTNGIYDTYTVSYSSTPNDITDTSTIQFQIPRDHSKIFKSNQNTQVTKLKKQIQQINKAINEKQKTSNNLVNIIKSLQNARNPQGTPKTAPALPVKIPVVAPAKNPTIIPPFVIPVNPVTTNQAFPTIPIIPAVPFFPIRPIDPQYPIMIPSNPVIPQDQQARIDAFNQFLKSGIYRNQATQTTPSQNTPVVTPSVPIVPSRPAQPQNKVVPQPPVPPPVSPPVPPSVPIPKPTPPQQLKQTVIYPTERGSTAPPSTGLVIPPDLPRVKSFTSAPIHPLLGNTDNGDGPYLVALESMHPLKLLSLTQSTLSTSQPFSIPLMFPSDQQNMSPRLSRLQKTTLFSTLKMLPMKKPEIPTARTIEFVNSLFKQPGVFINVQAERISRIDPEVIMIDAALRMKQGMLDLTRYVRIWAMYENMELIGIQDISQNMLISGPSITNTIKTQHKTIPKLLSILTQQLKSALKQSSHQFPNINSNSNSNNNNNNNIQQQQQQLQQYLIHFQYKQIGQIRQLQVYYQLSDFVIKAVVLAIMHNGQLKQVTILEMLVIANWLQELSYESMRYRELQVSKIRGQTAFVQIEKFVRKQYGDQITDDPKNILDISSKQINDIQMYEIKYAFKSYRITVSAIYNPQQSKLVGISFSPTMQSPPIGKGVAITVQLMKNCLLKQPLGTTCFQCRNGYYLNKNGHCFKKIPGCLIQSGIACIKCAGGYGNLQQNQYQPRYASCW